MLTLFHTHVPPTLKLRSTYPDKYYQLISILQCIHSREICASLNGISCYKVVTQCQRCGRRQKRSLKKKIGCKVSSNQHQILQGRVHAKQFVSIPSILIFFFPYIAGLREGSGREKGILPTIATLVSFFFFFFFCRLDLKGRRTPSQ